MPRLLNVSHGREGKLFQNESLFRPLRLLSKRRHIIQLGPQAKC